MKNLFYILFISLFVFSCDQDDNPISSLDEIDVDWVLVKTPDFCYDECQGLPGYTFFYTINSNLTHNIVPYYYTSESDTYTLDKSEIETDHLLQINYNNENLNYNIVDSFNGFNGSGDCILMSECGVNEFGQIETDEQGNCLNPLDFCTGSYRLRLELDVPVQRILYNEQLGYFTIFYSDGFFGVGLNVMSPNELIDFR